MAAESSTMAESLPLYVEDQVPQDPFDALLIRIAAPISSIHPNAHKILVAEYQAPAYGELEKSRSREPIDDYPFVEGRSTPDESTRLKQQIVKELFNSISREDTEAVALLIQHNLVTANTTSESGQTPLLEAVSMGSIRMVKEVLRLGADCNMFGEVVKPLEFDRYLCTETRTPLMLAASMGSLPIVKLLFEPPYSADDALVAPDGQIALRLASDNNHRPIVDYLPSRRAGGYLRFKTHHARSFRRIKKAFRQIWAVIKFFIWDVPKFFVWELPKLLVVLPVVRLCKWCWANRKKFGPWLKHQLTEMPKRIARFGKAVWRTTKKVGSWCKHQITEMPKRVARFGKAVWRTTKKVGSWCKHQITEMPKRVARFGKAVWNAAKKAPKVIWEAIKEVWKAIRDIGKALWKLLTVRIPNAILTALKWIWEGISSLARAIGDIFLKIASFLHAVLEAIISFLRNVTLRDIWNAFCDILRAVFVTLPQTLWSWIQAFGEASYRFMKALFGCFGEALWWICVLLKDIIIYLPVRIGIILLSLGNSLAKAFSEIMVWINPKA